MLTAASRPLSEVPRRMVLMGVAGCGKSSVGAALATRLGAAYRDGDDLHPSANIDKMSRGMALDDEDRWPWLTLVGQALAARSEGPQIIGCSALKRAYRAHITQTTRRDSHLRSSCRNARGHQGANECKTRPFYAGRPARRASSQRWSRRTRTKMRISVDIDRPLGAIVEAIVAQLEGMET